MTRKFRRLTAVLMAVLLAASSCPFSPAALAEDPPAVEEKPRVRFIQPENGFSEDGVLTMSLQVLVDPFDAADTTHRRKTVSEGMLVFQTASGTVIPMTNPKNGSPSEEIRFDPSKVAVIASTNSKAVEEFLIHTTDDGHLYDRGYQIAGSYNAAMGNLYSNPDFEEQYTGLLVAYDRNESGATTGMLNYYFQYRFNWGVFPDDPDGDGYVTITNFKFQCYSGTKNGVPLKATTNEALYSRSVMLPEDDTKAKAILDQFYTSYKYREGDEIVEVRTGSMAMGACGYMEKYQNHEYNDATGRWSWRTVKGDGYYYYSRPQMTPWRKGAGAPDTWCDNTTPTALNGTPYLKYDNMEHDYLINQFYILPTNTYSTDTDDSGHLIENYDFKVPNTEKSISVPRYQVPTAEKAKQRETAAEEQRNNGETVTAWIPGAHNTFVKDESGNQINKDMPLRYDLGTLISANSISSPESESFENFLSNIRWEFAFDSRNNHGKPFNELWTEEKLQLDEGAGEIVTTVTGEKLRVKKATIVQRPLKDGSGSYVLGSQGEKLLDSTDTFHFNGCKVQVVYTVANEADPSTDTFLMVAPVGVTIDMDPNTELTYYDAFPKDGGEAKDVTVRAACPQLHITSEAADPDSYLWKRTQAYEIGQVFLKATYHEAGTDYTAVPIEIRLYKEESKPTTTDLRVQEVQQVENTEGAMVDGFYAGRDVTGGTNNLNDVFMNGVKVNSLLYDQYGFVMEGYQNKLMLIPDETTKQALTKAKKETDPFVVTYVTPDLSDPASPKDLYTIKYKDGKNVNSIEAGYYHLRAFYGNIQSTLTVKDLFIGRDPNHLNFMRTTLERTVLFDQVTATKEQPGEVTVTLTVPPLNSDGSPAENSERIIIKELANQWRTSDENEFDILTDLRSADGSEIDLEKITADSRRLLSLKIEDEVPEGADITGINRNRVTGTDGSTISEGISHGEFTYNSSTANSKDEIGYTFAVKITGTYQYGKDPADIDTVTQVYKFKFTREESTLQRISLEAKNVTIPAKSLGRPTEAEIKFNPFDQYDRQMSWTEVEGIFAPGQPQNPTGIDYSDWGLCIDEEKTDMAAFNAVRPDGTTLADSIHLTGIHRNYISVDYTATDFDLYLYAKFGTKTSPTLKFEIRREPSRATTIADVVYNDGKPVKPDILESDGGVERTYTPTLTVHDQYGTEMTSGYEVLYSGVPSVETDLIEVRSDGTLVVKPCAPNCTVAISVSVYQDGVRRTSTATPKQVVVQRGDAIMKSLEVVTKELDFPLDTENRTFQLELLGKTQFGDAQDIAASDVEWTLHSITVPDTEGRLVTVAATSNEAGQVQLNKDGTLTFKPVSLSTQIPDSITVSVKYKGSTVSPQTPIDIKRAESYAASIYYLDSDFAGGVKVPDAVNNGDGTFTTTYNTFDLKAYLKDQYGAELDDPLTWTPVDGMPTDGSVTCAGNVVTVSSDAQQGAITFEASYGELEPVSVVLSIAQDDVVVTSVQLDSLKKNGTVWDSSNLNILLPGVTSKGDTYSLHALVKDQFGKKTAGAVRWSVDQASSTVDAKITGSSNNQLLVTYSETARDSIKGGTPGTIVINLHYASDPTIAATAAITVDLAANTPAYAVPTFVSATQVDENDGVTPVIPMKGEINILTYSAQVYSQYGEPMDGDAVIELEAESEGIHFKEQTGNTRELEVESKAPTTFRVKAWPVGMPDAVVAESVYPIIMSTSIRYEAELELAADNRYTVDVPGWNSGHLAAVPGAPTESDDPPVLVARVVDQLGTWMNYLSDTYPLWQFVGEHPGVEFADSTAWEDQAAGIAKNETVTLKLTNEAAVQKSVQIKVWTNTKDPDDPDFAHVITLNLECSYVASNPATNKEYLYFKDVTEEDGGAVIDTSLKRPDTNQEKASYQVTPQVFDQYGRLVTDAEVELKLDYNENTFGKSVEVEETYRAGESAEKGDSPVSYQLYRLGANRLEEARKNIARDGEAAGSRVLIAEFDAETGVLTVYPACNVDVFTFIGTCDKVKSGNSKRVKLKIDLGAPVPYAVVLTPNIAGNIEITPNKEEEDPRRTYTAAVYDQFGDAYSGSINLKFKWGLYVKDPETGDLLPYDTELDSEGNEKPFKEDFLVLLDAAETTTRNNSITVQAEQFFEEKDLVLRCETTQPSGVPFDPVVIDYAEIHVTEPKSGSGGSGLAVTVTFDAGAHGKLVGPSEIATTVGSLMENAPGVKTEEGYGFVGWTEDGRTMIDPRMMYVYQDMTLVAVYKDITNTKFLDGYEDGTVRPDQKVTRAEFVKMLISAVGGYDANVNYGKSYSDVPDGRYYTNYVAYAKQEDVVDGYEDGTFRPGNVISRAEAAKLIAVTMGLEKEMGTTFSDVKKESWYAGYIEALKKAGIVDGYEDGTYRPDNAISRAEAVKLIIMITKNALGDLERQNIQEYAYCPFIDLKKGSWAYAYIVRAAGIA